MAGAPSRRGGRRALTTSVLVALCVLGLGLLVASGRVLATGRHLPDEYSVSTAPHNALRAVPSDRVGASSSSASSSSAVPSSGRSSAADVSPQAAGFVPSTLQIGSLHVSAPVVSSDADAGVLLPPERPQTVGWWLGGALAGSGTGSTVIVGHIDSATRGLGALFHLDRLKAGNRVTVSSGRSAASYRVVSLHFYVKTTGLPAALFTRTGAPRLVLISCAGSFDRAKGSYRDNVVVTAVPA